MRTKQMPPAGRKPPTDAQRERLVEWISTNVINYDGLVMANLWLSLMDRMGVSVERHGDSTGRLPSLRL